MRVRITSAAVGWAAWLIVVPGAMAAATPAIAPSQPVAATRLVSVRADGEVPRRRWSGDPAVSGSGRYVAFTSQVVKLIDPALCTGLQYHLYVRDRVQRDVTVLDLRPNGKCSKKGTVGSPSMSADGRSVAFLSEATRLVPEGTDPHLNVFVRDLVAATTAVVSIAVDGGRADAASDHPDMSADGSTVVFHSWARNLVPDAPADFPVPQVYRRDLDTGRTWLVSKTPTGGFPDGPSYAPSVSGDGNLIAYVTSARDIVEGGDPEGNVVLYDASADESTLISQPPGPEPPDGPSSAAEISADGTTIAYLSWAENLVPAEQEPREESNWLDLFRHDLKTGETLLVTRSHDGGPADSNTEGLDIDGQGRRITFWSTATDLVPDDDNSAADAFLYDSVTELTALVTRTPTGQPAELGGGTPAISRDGSIIVYESMSGDIIDPGRRFVSRVYAYRVW